MNKLDIPFSQILILFLNELGRISIPWKFCAYHRVFNDTNDAAALLT